MTWLEKLFQFIEEALFGEPQPLPVNPPPMPPPQTPTAPTSPITPPGLLWDTPHNAYHSVRVLCDEAGLTYEQKNLICAVIYGESEFNNNAKCYNKNAAGVVTSVDVGLCQINSYFHTGPSKDFPSTDYVINHPGMAVRWMITMYKEGLIKQWVAYSSGRYKQFIGKQL